RLERAPVVMRGDRSEAATAHRGHARTLGLDPPPRLLVVRRRDQLLLAGPDLKRERSLTGLGQDLGRLEAVADLGRQPESLETARGQHDRVEPPLVSLPQPRID